MNILETAEHEKPTLHGILDRGASKQEPIATLKPQESLPSNTRGVLDVLRFVQDHVLPLDTLEVLLVLCYELVTGDEHMEGSVLVVADFFLAPKLSQSRSVLHVTPVWQRLEFWDESSKLLLPVVKRRSGCNDKEWAPNIMGFCQVCQERN